MNDTSTAQGSLALHDENIEPVFEEDIGPVRVAVVGNDRDGRPRNLSLGPLKEPGDEQKPECAELVNILKGFASRESVASIFAPIPTQFNGRIVGHHEFASTIRILDGERGNVSLHRGVCADGVVLHSRGQGFAFSSGGCPLVVLWRTDRVGEVAVAHAGLRSLIRWREDDQDHWNRSVAAALFYSLSLNRETANKCRAAIVLPIDPEAFSHPLDEPDPKRYSDNKKLFEYLRKWYDSRVLVGDPNDVCVDIAELALQQLEQLGIRRERIWRGPHTGDFPGRLETTRGEHPSFRYLQLVGMR